MEPLELLNKIVHSTIEAVKPDKLIFEKINYKNHFLTINNRAYDLSKYKKVHLVGSGKASVIMAKAIKELIGDKVSGGVIISNYYESIDNISVLVGSHPLPTEKTIKATERLLEYLEKVQSDDFIIYLLSGGTSALLEKPVYPLTLEDIKEITNILLKKGLNIKELNSIRKRLSSVKGGKLNNYINCSGVVLVLSDVLGDKVETIGSAPLYYKKESLNILNLLKKYSLEKVLSKDIINLITYEDKIVENKLEHFIIGSNHDALIAAKNMAYKFGLDAQILTNTLRGQASEAGKFITSIGEYVSSQNMKDRLYIFGGETTVFVKGNGLGGRNQELALSALNELSEFDYKIYVAAFGTDGLDGPTDAAGAIISKGLLERAKKCGISIEEFLYNNDSYNFFKKVGGHIITGPTGTNVCDVILLLIK
ncbi:MAG: DUF4147 domain-containing protein [Deferribacterota bacterium]|nr:DUF4147 domain-containing protein [Deferribacterota bacterium]